MDNFNTPAAIHREKEFTVPIACKNGWAPELVSKLWSKENVSPLPGIETRPSKLCPITIPTELLLNEYSLTQSRS
jgi:hypothetical protein